MRARCEQTALRQAEAAPESGGLCVAVGGISWVGDAGERSAIPALPGRTVRLSASPTPMAGRKGCGVARGCCGAPRAPETPLRVPTDQRPGDEGLTLARCTRVPARLGA